MSGDDDAPLDRGRRAVHGEGDHRYRRRRHRAGFASLAPGPSNRDRAVTRACSWNLIGIEADAEEPRTRAAVEQQPFLGARDRSILVPRPKEPGKADQRSSRRTPGNAPGGGKLLCSEGITVMSRVGGDKPVPMLVRALLVPDVPTVSATGRRPIRSRSRSSRSVDGVILSPSRHRRRRRCDDVAAYAKLEGSRVADFAWLRMGFSGRCSRRCSIREQACSSARRGCRHGRQRPLPPSLRGVGRVASRLSPDRSTSARSRRAGAVRHADRCRDADRATPSGIVEVLGWKTTDDDGKPGEHGLGDSGDGTLLGAIPRSVEPLEDRRDLAPERLVIAALGARGRDPLYRAALDVSPGASR